MKNRFKYGIRVYRLRILSVYVYDILRLLTTRRYVITCSGFDARAGNERTEKKPDGRSFIRK